MAHQCAVTVSKATVFQALPEMITEPFVRKTLPAFEFARLAFDIADHLPADRVHLRYESGDKEFLEEILPIATFAKIWEKPGRRLSIEYFGPNHPYDATVALQGLDIDKGYLESFYYLEVTSAV